MKIIKFLGINLTKEVYDLYVKSYKTYANSFEKTLSQWKRLKAKGEGGGRGWDGWIAWLTHRHELEQTLGYSGGQGSLTCAIVHGVAQSQTWFSDWTTTNK